MPRRMRMLWGVMVILYAAELIGCAEVKTNRPRDLPPTAQATIPAPGPEALAPSAVGEPVGAAPQVSRPPVTPLEAAPRPAGPIPTPASDIAAGAGPLPIASAKQPTTPPIAPAGESPHLPRRAAAAKEFRIGDEDEVEVSVYGNADLVKTQTVRPDGKISFPLVGELTVRGLTPEELRTQIATGLARYVREPRVTVVVTKYNSNKVSVLGEVKSPGLLRLVSDITLLEALSRVGGVNQEADLQRALLLRNGVIEPADFHRLIRHGDTTQNVWLESGDTILIPNVNEQRVLILGQVSRPLALPLTPALTLVESISRAGGITEDADLRGALFVRERQVLPVDFEKLLRHGDFGQNVTMQQNDTVLIPSIKDKKAFVLGQVTRPQVITLTPGTTLLESISRAGGLTDDADLAGAMLLRDGQVQAVSFDKLLRGDASQNIPLSPNDVILIPNVKDRKVFVLGEVTRPLVTTLKPGSNVVEAISLAGGFTPDAKRESVLVVRGGLGDPKLIKVDVDAVTKRGDLAENLALEPGDIVYAPRTIISDVVKFANNLNTILSPVVSVMSAIVLGQSVSTVFTGGTAAQPVAISP
jgi:protein involved in polysaccharide export with SLBB domain